MSNRKLWDGHAWHPLLECLSQELQSRGYTAMGFSADGDGGISWSKPAFEGYSFELDLLPQPAQKGSISISAGLSVQSTRQVAVELLLGTARCYPSQPISGTSATVLFISLPWLMMRWEPIAGANGEAFLRWKHVLSADHERMASDILYHLDHQGEDFFNLVSTPGRLADVLQDLEGFPGRGALPSGPLSSDPLEFAAVLLNDLKRPKEALDCLDRNLSLTREKVVCGDWSEGMLQAIECKHALYKKWLRKN